MGGAPRSRKVVRKTPSDSEESTLLCENIGRRKAAPSQRRKWSFSSVTKYIVNMVYKVLHFVRGKGDDEAKQGTKSSTFREKMVFIRSVLNNKSLTPMQRVYLFFGLRQGTMLIAVHDMLWCSFLVFLLVLGTAHAREVSEMVEADVEDNAAREGLGLLPEELVHMVQSRIRHDNDAKLHHALHMATVVTLMMFLGIGMAGVDMIASMMLLAGALLRVRQLMMPWLSIRLLEMMLIMALLLFSLVWFHTFKLAILGTAGLCIIFYHWLVAYSLHEHLCLHERANVLTHRTSTPMRATNSAGGCKHTTPAPATPRRQPPSANVPHIPNIVFAKFLADCNEHQAYMTLDPPSYEAASRDPPAHPPTAPTTAPHHDHYSYQHQRYMRLPADTDKPAATET